VAVKVWGCVRWPGSLGQASMPAGIQRTSPDVVQCRRTRLWQVDVRDNPPTLER
jgi:hypothetical protein